MSNTTDVIIIGGGVHGASLAFHLAQRGVKTIVLEKNFVASGATGRSSGLVRMHYDTELDSQLAWKSFSYFRNWEQMVGGDCGFVRTGFIQIVAREHADHLRANVLMHQRIGIPSLVVNADDVRRLAPSFRTDDFDVAAYEPESGYAAPSDTAMSLMHAARERGARLIQDCEVTGVQVAGGKVKGLQTTQGDFAAPVVVNAAGPWAGKIIQLAGLDIPCDTWRHDVMVIKRPPEIGPTHPTVIDFPGEMYFRPEQGGLTLVGLEDGNPLGESPDGDADHAKAGFVERAIERICARIPAMEKGHLHSAHSGYDGITPDQHPIIGATDVAGFYLDCGLSGMGFKIAPAVGLCMSELILDGKTTTLDISDFTPSRFADGRSVKGSNSYDYVWR
jgi:sarcosine oxidase, subunit beta